MEIKMKIDNKFDIGEAVMFGGNKTKITGIIIFPNGFAYKLSCLDHETTYTCVEVYEFEISKHDENKLGFSK
jgi:hypothetical protein